MPSAITNLQKLLHGVAEISSAVNEPVSVPTLLNLVAEMACELLRFDFCGVFLADARGEVLVVEGSHGFTPAYITEVNALHPLVLREGEVQAPSTRAFLTKQSVQVTDTRTDPAFAPWGEGARAQGFTSMIAVPLLVSGSALGTLNGYTSESHEFTRDEIDLATTLANQVAIAIATARLRSAQARSIEELQELNRSLEEQHRLLEQGEEIHRRLTGVALREGGVAGVAEALSALLGRALVVEDASGRQLASVALDGVALEIADLHRDFLTSSTADPGTNGLWELALPDGESADARRVHAPIWLGSELAARIWVAGGVDDLGALDRRAIEHATTVLALELVRLRTAMEVEWRTAADLVRDLINGHPADAVALRPRAERMGHDLDLPHVVVVVRADTDTDDLGAAMISSTRAVASPVTPRPLVATSGALVVALWPVTDSGAGATTVADAIRATFRRMRPDATISVTVTAPCHSLDRYAGAYRMGRGVAELAHRRGVTDTTLQLGDLGPLSLLLQVESTDELMTFIDRVLGPLRDHDEHRNASLAATVAAYFRHDLNTAAAAAALHVHPNTVGLRIRRAEELLGMSFTKVDSVVHVGLALMAGEVVQVGGEPGPAETSSAASRSASARARRRR
nr:GAF domain-containing protein [Georgenia sp. H159]